MAGRASPGDAGVGADPLASGTIGSRASRLLRAKAGAMRPRLTLTLLQIGHAISPDAA